MGNIRDWVLDLVTSSSVSRRVKAAEEESPILPTKLDKSKWELKKRPKAVPADVVDVAEDASPEALELYDNIEDSLSSLAQIKAVVDQAKAEFQARVKEIEEKSRKHEREAELQSAITALADLIEETEGNVIKVRDNVLSIEKPKGKFTASPTWKYKKLLDKFGEAADTYLENAVRGAKSLDQPATFRRLLRWPNKQAAIASKDICNIIFEIQHDLIKFNDAVIELQKDLSGAPEPAMKAAASSNDIDFVARVFDYLDVLRMTGATNMFGASAYLVKEFGISSREASDLLKLWMKTFDENLSAGERAKQTKESSLREPDLVEVFEYLDHLHEGGVSDLHASMYLSDFYEMPSKKAIDLFTQWRDTFNENLSAEERAVQFRESSLRRPVRRKARRVTAFEDNVDFVTAVYVYLDAIRAAGAINMYSAASYVAEEFDIHISEARHLLTQWMESFDEELSAGHRAVQFRESSLRSPIRRKAVRRRAHRRPTHRHPRVAARRSRITRATADKVVDEDAVFRYLDMLRDTKSVDMSTAEYLVMAEFNVPIHQAIFLYNTWKHSYDEHVPVRERADYAVKYSLPEGRNSSARRRAMLRANRRRFR